MVWKDILLHFSDLDWHSPGKVVPCIIIILSDCKEIFEVLRVDPIGLIELLKLVR